ncbi:CO5A3 protein, partial [Urocolius indicus]|nr:CO5A3 protein [Urocolius indicus]
AEPCPVFSWGWGGAQIPPSSPHYPVLSLAAPQLEYPGASPVQLRFLRLHSRWATQKVSYSCRPVPGQSQPQSQQEIHFLADSREQSYIASLEGCLPDNNSASADTIFQFSTEELWLLPLRDLAVLHAGHASHQFGFTVGPVCFS